MNFFFSSIITNIVRSFTKYYGVPHILAIVLTYILVTSNFDWYYFVHMRNPLLVTLFFPAIPIGGLVPIVTPILVVLLGIITRRRIITVIGWALTQAVILGSFISSVYKALTGRIQPNVHDLITDGSHQFNFGFFEHGIFWGWPSSHTTIAFAMAVTLATLFPKNRVAQVLVMLYAFYIGIGISFSIHWFSEFAAGALIGTVIGMVVGKSFKTILVEKIEV